MTIYLDNNASTAPDQEVVDAVIRAMSGLPGNPASHHTEGFLAAEAVERARNDVAALVAARSQDVVFTSGATEANNLAIHGVWAAARQLRPGRKRVLVGATEHPSVLESSFNLRSLGAAVDVIPVDRLGRIDLTALELLIGDDVLLVSVMAANNETGVLSPLAEVAEVVHRAGALLHCDATQAMGRIAIDTSGLALDLVSLSGHKMHGPKGVGALIVDRHVPIEAQLVGGGHERGLRSGTLNVPGIVGLGIAARLAVERLGEAPRIGQLRDHFVSDLAACIPDVEVNGDQDRRLPNTVNLHFKGADAEAVLAGMPGIACSSGSACSSATPTPSPVLLAMGLTSTAASESLRFSLSRHTTREELSAAVEILAESVNYVRALLRCEVR